MKPFWEFPLLLKNLLPTGDDEHPGADDHGDQRMNPYNVFCFFYSSASSGGFECLSLWFRFNHLWID